MYASTEIGPAPFQTPWTTDFQLLSETVGKPPVTVDFKCRIKHLVEDRYCSVGEEGEIECLSPMRMVNYWHDRHLPKMGWVSSLTHGVKLIELSLQWETLECSIQMVIS